MWVGQPRCCSVIFQVALRDSLTLLGTQRARASFLIHTYTRCDVLWFWVCEVMCLRTGGVRQRKLGA